jgi:NTP pyrophosphatase (non-canonical NTP hydrolase)
MIKYWHKLEGNYMKCNHEERWEESEYYDGSPFECIWCMPGKETEMTLNMNEYQDIARRTAIYKDAIIYPALGLAGEAGEVAEKIKKLIRDKGGVAGLSEMEEEDHQAVAKEIGDVMWYCANLSLDIGYKLEDVAKINIGKLAKRQIEGKLSGSGDNR